jgi:hypothetical protein
MKSRFDSPKSAGPQPASVAGGRIRRQVIGSVGTIRFSVGLRERGVRHLVATAVTEDAAMRRWILSSSLGAAVIVGSGFCFAPAASAGWNEFWNRVHVDFHRNNAWPEPFQSADRAAAREPFCIMVNNGWKMQNTIGTFLFNAETNELNSAGEAKVKWVVTQAPIHRRAVFVLVGDTPQDTKARLESVQRYISRIMPEGNLPPVMLTNTEPDGASGEYFDAVNRAMMQSIPAPRLPGGDSGGGSSSGGGGNSGN